MLDSTDLFITNLNGLILKTIAYRLVRKIEMAGRLAEKLQLAGSVVGRQHAKIEARADAIIAREQEIEKLTDQAFIPHEAMLDDAEKGLEDLQKQLVTLTNAPLDSGAKDSKQSVAPGSNQMLPNGTQ